MNGIFKLGKYDGSTWYAHSVKLMGVSGNSVYMSKDDLLANIETGEVYKCTRAGSQPLNTSASTLANAPLYQYLRTDVVKAPTATVSGLSKPTMDADGRLTVKWTAYKAGSSDCARFESLEVEWDIVPSDVIGNWGGNIQPMPVGATSSTFDMFGMFSRSSFFPVTDLRVARVEVRVRGKNSKGAGPWVRQAFSFFYPRKPSVALSFDDSTGELSINVKSGDGAPECEWYSTELNVLKRNPSSKNWSSVLNATTQNTEQTWTVDVANWQALGAGQSIDFDVTAVPRGISGPKPGSESQVQDKRAFRVSFPGIPTLTNVKATGREQGDRVTVAVGANGGENFALEVLADSEYMNAGDIPATAEWVATSAADSGKCTAMSIPVAECMPSPGRRSWLRLKVWTSSERLCSYSTPVAVLGLETPAPTAQDDKVKILSAQPQSDGQTMFAIAAWDDDDSDGTEVSWSSDPNAWESVAGPSTFETSRDDGARLGKSHTLGLFVGGLAEGANYIFKARRYMDHADGTREYGPYSDAIANVLARPLDSVSASCDRHIARGRPLEVSWRLQPDVLQQGWSIGDAASGAILASGSGTRMAAQIDADRLAHFADVNGNLTIFVSASTGRGSKWSNAMDVTIVDPPALTLTVGSTLAAQPLSFTANAGTGKPQLRVVVRSTGSCGETPRGFERQPEGDVVYSALLTPTYNASGNATVRLPRGLGFRDNATYELSVTAIDDLGLETERTATFEVDWSRKAVPPVVSCEEVDEVADDGSHVQGVRVSIAAGSGARATDVYDVYRLSGGSPSLIADGLAAGASVLDPYAPYGGMVRQVRVACRTVDGDEAWADGAYHLQGDALRIDWEGGSVELPYNLTLQDSYAKGVEVRTHMDGTEDAYYDGSVKRKASLSSDIIALDGPAQVDAVRALARHAGPAFVRTPEGQAFAANVDIAGLSQQSARLASVAIDAEEVELPDAFKIDTEQS